MDMYQNGHFYAPTLLTMMSQNCYRKTMYRKRPPLYPKCTTLCPELDLILIAEAIAHHWLLDYRIVFNWRLGSQCGVKIIAAQIYMFRVGDFSDRYYWSVGFFRYRLPRHYPPVLQFTESDPHWPNPLTYKYNNQRSTNVKS